MSEVVEIHLTKRTLRKVVKILGGKDGFEFVTLVSDDGKLAFRSISESKTMIIHIRTGSAYSGQPVKISVSDLKALASINYDPITLKLGDKAVAEAKNRVLEFPLVPLGEFDLKEPEEKYFTVKAKVTGGFLKRLLSLPIESQEGVIIKIGKKFVEARISVDSTPIAVRTGEDELVDIDMGEEKVEEVSVKVSPAKLKIALASVTTDDIVELATGKEAPLRIEYGNEIHVKAYISPLFD